MIVSDPITDSDHVVDRITDHVVDLIMDSDRVVVTGRITDRVVVSEWITGVMVDSDMAEVDSDTMIHLDSILVMDLTFSSITITISRRRTHITTAGLGKWVFC
jgi:hypothetical protein